MAKRTKSSPANAAWKTQLPRNGDAKTWIRAGLRKAEAIEDAGKASWQARWALEKLAALDRKEESFRHLSRILRRLEKAKSLDVIHVAELGAEFCLKAGDLEGVERYLAIVESAERFVTRNCDKGWPEKAARQFRADQGILDPTDAVDEEQRQKARLRKAERGFRLSLAKGNRKSARVFISAMEEIAYEKGDSSKSKAYLDSKRQLYLRQLFSCLAELGDANSIKQCVGRLSDEDRDHVLWVSTLMDLGLKDDAKARARREIEENWEELRAAPSGLHVIHPVGRICDHLEFLVEQNERDEARNWLTHLLAEDYPDPPPWYGWAISCSLCSLASAAAAIDGPTAAEELLAKAQLHANTGRSDFRIGAVREFIGLKVKIGKWNEAYDFARKLRSPTLKRDCLTRLLTQAKRWSDLHEVLNHAATPEEAADLARTVASLLVGGEGTKW